MPIDVRKALEILSEVLIGEKPKKFFQQNRIALDGLQMEASEFNHKLNGRRNFTKADYIRLAHYFDLGEEGHKLLQVESEEAFRVGLRGLGVGQYTKNPAQLLALKLSAAAMKSSASLELCDISSIQNNRSGLVSAENAKPPTGGLSLRVGDRLRLRFSFPNAETEPLWFAAFNIHSTSGTVRILNPVFKESAIQICSGQLYYPESSFLEIRDATLLGTHRLIAIACTSGFRSTLLEETSRLLAIYNNTDRTDVDNHFEGLLDTTALQNIDHASLTGVVHCAVLEYRQVYGAQQP